MVVQWLNPSPSSSQIGPTLTKGADMTWELRSHRCAWVLMLMALLGSILASTSGTWAASSPKPVDSDDLDVQVGKTVEITSSFRFCWFPTVHQFPTGEIMVTMQHSPDEVNAEGDFSAYCLSRDGGQTWSRRYTMGAGCSADGPYATVPRPDGSIWHLYSYPEPYPAGQAQVFHDTLTKFSHGGMMIEQIRDVTLKLSEPGFMTKTGLFDRKVRDGAEETQIRGMPWGSIVDGLHSELLCPMYYITAADAKRYQKGDAGPYRDVLLRSVDQGQTWVQYSTIAAIPPDQKPAWVGNEGPNEANLVRLADQRLYSIYRTGDPGMLGNAWSSDDGKTWTAPRSTGLQGVAPRILRLSNGMLALTTGRPGPIVIAFSTDGTGQKWSHVTALFSEMSIHYTGSPTQYTRSSRWSPLFSGMSTHYTGLIELAPGKLLVVYDIVPYFVHAIPFSDAGSKNAIYGTFIEVHKK